MRLADRVSLPYAAVFLAGAVLLGELVPGADELLSIEEVERIAIVALVVILFHGGLHIGPRRFRRSAGPILALGVVGTFLTAGVVTLAAHYVLGLDWIEAGLVGAALAPTDPAVTFSVFGAREVRGRSGTILEGEAGMNDPVGIALMIGMIELATAEDGNLSIVAGEFAREMALGLAAGVVGALALLPVIRRVRLTSPALYPIRVLAGAGIIYGIAAVVGGSGFLAVFVAGVLLGDAAAPRKGEIEDFHASLAGLAEIAAFIALGLSIAVSDLDELATWSDGLVLALVLVIVARPLAVLPLLLPARLSRGERLFVVWSGLKGAVPDPPGSARGTRGRGRRGAPVRHRLRRRPLLGGGAGRVGPVRGAEARDPVPPRRPRPRGGAELVVREDAFARGRRLGELPLGERAWVGVLVRDGRPHPVDDDVVLQLGDRVHVYCQPEDAPALHRLFEGGD